MQPFDAKKYLIVFVLTSIIFAFAFSLSSYFGNQKIAEVRSIQDKISLDILSSETKYEILGELSCEDIDSSILSQELNSLAERLTYLENNRAQNDLELMYLKNYYSILEIKDYLLTKKVKEKCPTKTPIVLYFYSNAEKCENCEKMGYVLTYLRQQYPNLRVYSFDYDMDSSAVKTLIGLYNIKDEQPAYIVDRKVYYGLRSIEDMQKLLPDLVSKDVTTSKK